MRDVGEMDGALAVDEARRTIESAGGLLKSLRRKQGLSITALAERADLSSGLLSQIERGQGNPSFITLVKLAYALNVPVGGFLTGSDPAEGGVVVRKDKRKRLVMPHENISYELLTPNLGGALEVVKAQIAARWDNEAAPFVHAGEECVTILSGSLDIHVEEQEYHLDEGDSITLDPTRPHWYRNATDEHAILIGVVTPPSF